MPKFADNVSAAIIEATGNIVGKALQQTLGSNQHNEAKKYIAEYVEVTVNALIKQAHEIPKQ